MFTKKIIGLLLASASPSGASAAEMDRPLSSAPPEEVVYIDRDTKTATNPFTGNLEASFNAGKTDLTDLDNKTWGLRGALNYAFEGGLNVQGDIDWGQTSLDDNDFNRIAGTAHIYYRPVEDYAVGAFAQTSQYGTDLFNPIGFGGVIDDKITDTIGGVEAAYFTDLATAYGAVGYGQAEFGIADMDHTMGRLGVRYFLTDNLRLDAEGSLHQFSFEDVDLDARSVKTVVNFRPESMPTTFFAGYRYDEWESSVSDISLAKEKNHSILAGVRVSFGANSLKDEERNGPIWSSTSILP